VSSLVLVEEDAGVAVLTLNRPEKRNALSLELRDELADAIEACAERASCLVLTGAGSAFCAGMDVTQFGGDRANRERIVATSARLFAAVARCRAPVVAALNGPAIAGGFALALLCDIRVAGESACMGFPEVGRHIPPSYGAARAALPPALARELCLTGQVLDATEALRRGVVSEVVPDAELSVRARALAAQIAGAPRSATREVKRRAILEGEATWGRLLDDELDALRAAVLR
jgi:enoyl-CoA hydratase/carnithine racemase